MIRQLLCPSVVGNPFRGFESPRLNYHTILLKIYCSAPVLPKKAFYKLKSGSYKVRKIKNFLNYIVCVGFSCCDLTRSSLPRAERQCSYASGKCVHVTGRKLRPVGLAPRC